MNIFADPEKYIEAATLIDLESTPENLKVHYLHTNEACNQLEMQGEKEKATRGRKALIPIAKKLREHGLL